jgi:hypothetical protein
MFLTFEPVRRKPLITSKGMWGQNHCTAHTFPSTSASHHEFYTKQNRQWYYIWYMMCLSIVDMVPVGKLMLLSQNLVGLFYNLPI